MFNNWLPLGVAVLATVLVTEGVTMSVIMWDIVVTEDDAVVVAMLDDIIAIIEPKNTGVTIIIQIYVHYVTS